MTKKRKTETLNFIYDNNNPKPGYSHWDHCCDNNLPYIRVLTIGIKYWKLEFDMFPVTKCERFNMLNYADHINPLYKVYAKNSELPSDKFLFVGGDRNGSIVVRKENAYSLAELLYELLIQLHAQDQKLFDENPFYINEEGYNPEGYHVENFKKDLERKTTNELASLHKAIQNGNKHHKQALLWIEEEVKSKLQNSKPQNKILKKYIRTK